MLVFIFAITMFIVGAYVGNVLVRWAIGNSPPTITLIHPAHNQTLHNQTIKFNWTSSDANGDPLTHVWYVDTTSSMNSPNLHLANVGSAQEYYYTLQDGVWYWKVEVTDNKSIVTSETRRFVVWKYTSNHFPELSNGVVFPSTGNESTLFTYYVTWYDPDGDSPSYIHVIIDGIPHNMTTDDGTQYYYKTKLYPGTHWYSFEASDGIAICSLPRQVGPTVYGLNCCANTPPTITLIAPSNGDILTSNNVTFKWQVYDPDNNYVRSELWLYHDSLYSQKQVYDIESNTTLDLTIGTYYWRVCAYDRYSYNLSEIWAFQIQMPGKRCKITLQPDNTEAMPGEDLTGQLVITNEGEEDIYEVYWYITLENETISGALALSTTSIVPYRLTVPSIPAGTYTLIAKVYDKPRNEADAEQIGMDTIRVVVKPTPPVQISDLTIQNLALVLIIAIISAGLGIIVNKLFFMGTLYSAVIATVILEWLDWIWAIILCAFLTALVIFAWRKKNRK